MTFTFAAVVAWDPIGKQAVKNTSFQVYAQADTGFVTPLAITDTFGATLPWNILNSGSQGVFPEFEQATESTVVITDPSHTYVWTITAIMQDTSVAAFVGKSGSASRAAVRAAISADLGNPASDIAGQLNATYAPASGSANYATPASVTAAVTPKLDSATAATIYAAKSVETSKLDVTTAASTYSTPASVAAQIPPAVSNYIANDPSVVNSAATMAQNTAGLVPVWKASTTYVAGQRAIAPNGDIVAAKANFTSGATYSPSNWNPSAQDGRIGAIEGTVQGGAHDALSFAVLDKDGRRTWLEADLAGNPTDRVKTLLTGGIAVASLPTDDWAHWGDSLTDERVTGADGWVTKLAALTGKTHYNGGWYGQKAGEIAARQGGLPAVVTLPSSTIPASGPVTLTAIRNSPVEVHASLGVYGTLAGVHGFMREQTTDVTTFARDTPGTAVACPPGTRFIPDDGATLRDRHVTVWVGRNDVYFTDPRLVVSSIRAQIDYLSTSVKRVLVLEVIPSTTSPNTHPQLSALNNAIKAAFPAEWVPISTWLRTDAAASAAGITFTTDDQTDIAAGITPRSFRSDTVHLNATGCTAVATYLYSEAQERGWLA